MVRDTPRRGGFVVLPDGRKLAYVEWGDPRGVPVIHQHGMPGSRLDHAAPDQLYELAGVRVITPDRPGYGLSDPQRRRTLLEWPRDVTALADQLGIGRFAVTALSGGGVYALAVAAAVPDRLTDVVLVGCPAPLQRRGALRGMRVQNVVGLKTAAVAPWAFRAVVAALSGAVRGHPGAFLAQGTHDQPPSDRLWTTLPWVQADAVCNLREAFRQGGLAYSQDIALLARPWGFMLQDITAPIQLWHGDEDRVIPLHHARYLASVLPNATLQTWEGEGHMLMWNHISEILEAARGKRQLRLVR